MKTSRKKLWTHFPGSAPGPLTICLTIHIDIFISGYIISMSTFHKIAVINTLNVQQNNLCQYHGIHILQTIGFMESGFHGNHISFQTSHFHSICDHVRRYGYLLTFYIGFTYPLHFKSSIMLAYYFYNTYFRHICRKDVIMETLNL